MRRKLVLKELSRFKIEYGLEAEVYINEREKYGLKILADTKKNSMNEMNSLSPKQKKTVNGTLY